jgi:hypothetical protein
MCAVAEVHEAKGEDERYEEHRREDNLTMSVTCPWFASALCELTRVRSGSCSESASGLCDGDDGGDGIGVLASLSKESGVFLCINRG